MKTWYDLKPYMDKVSNNLNSVIQMETNDYKEKEEMLGPRRDYEFQYKSNQL